jgi:hypothetical protein
MFHVVYYSNNCHAVFSFALVVRLLRQLWYRHRLDFSSLYVMIMLHRIDSITVQYPCRVGEERPVDGRSSHVLSAAPSCSARASSLEIDTGSAAAKEGQFC